ncbi:MAG TPA: helix-turn-helix domain-containing protein [Flexivirga sp.]|uniref:AraC family transcriptional regulator n=1 Tax=Flexivirga sp. TaxID=1962927 RepID=UPI002B610A38|nr:helix-turn-helix domain-containing protein [Flexivirga sp.]HWC23085.1 helix-turn-helix domain-containing protein [Flexivirga sp.]
MANRTFATTDGVILDPRRFAEHATLARPACHPALDAWVEHYWTVRWQLPAGASYRSSLLPVAQANLTIEPATSRRAGATTPGVFVTGVVSRTRFDVTLTGSGSVVGVKFRPGALTALTGVPATGLRDRVLPAADLFAGADALAGLSADDPDVDEALDAFLLALPRAESTAQTTELEKLAVVIAVLEDSTPAMSAAQLADRCGLGLRSLQRLCRHYIGVGPQWLVARARVHTAVARLHAGDYDTLADLAVELGWFDQAHFGRDFTALVGESPGAYRDRVFATSG